MLNTLVKELMILRAFCVLIALSMGILSPLMANATPSGTALSSSEYALPDGTLPIICFGNGDGETESAVHCDDCLLNDKTVAKLPLADHVELPLVLELGRVSIGLQSNVLHDFLEQQRSHAPPFV